jgi:predicted DNA binding CopG/RHH family protein
MKTLQKFNPKQLEACRDLKPEQIIEFIDQFRRLHGARELNNSPSKLISMKVPIDLLEAFKTKAKIKGIPYQSKIKELMLQWLCEG